MSGVNDSPPDLEKHRLQLEENISRLTRALRHWQTWDAEYEALKEEIEAVGEPCSPDELRRVHDEFDGELLVGKEIGEVFGVHELKPRNQIINVLQRRIDYVGKNVVSLEKQLEAAENKYAAATAGSQLDAVDEAGQPITEIIEELDDEDNVVSYRLNNPGAALPKVKEALERAGVDDLEYQTPEAEEKSGISAKEPNEVSLKPKPAAPRQPTLSGTPPAPPVKKSVSFSEDVKAANPLPEMSVRAKRVDRIMRTAKEQESISHETAIIPEDEDPDDAALRQQMLQYGMGEVGAVVAELELEEVDSDDDSGFDYGDDDFDDDDSEEDRFGRSTGGIVTDKYRQRMLELEQKLGIKSRFTEQAEQTAQDERPNDDTEGIGRIVVKREPDTTPSASKCAPPRSHKGGEGVRFAQTLDIAPENKPPASKPAREAAGVEPLSDVVERTTPTKTPETKATRKPSRFKKARGENVSCDAIPKGPFDVPSRFLQQEPRVVPTGPEGSTMADKLIERDTPTSVTAPDELDDSMAHQEVADEYQRMRRKFIHRDGGFLKADESIIQPLDEADGGEPISRFKAARLSKQ
ncbi:uncharacterized protein MAM_05269 [Metarhizium album ARSEF 1941]|uniref:DUF3835 domain-containing protein n=1 Tax=Metarhizium album (strain ARSEF 1941) TaxID=1081103 RepID=A0A0B2WRR2_METAS|nr:uncharacterized protein MAM_05269 [Metarhizium album ARSEF 1941]KHN96713.1 hypothetical protein MAM_05269 [Metarhizium album ARSEF 1941]